MIKTSNYPQQITHSEQLTKLILRDWNKGKEICWKEKKRTSRVIGKSLLRMGLSDVGSRVLDCSSLLGYNKDGKLSMANFCRFRFCPICAWRKSLKLFAQLSSICNFISLRLNLLLSGEEIDLTSKVSEILSLKHVRKIRYIFLTLTIKNMTGAELRNAVSSMSKGFSILMKNRKVARISLGAFRNIEITKNRKTGEFHPHIHALICVDESYFDSPSTYITNKQWGEFWQSAMNIPYRPVVDVRKVKDDNTPSVIAEIAKYTIKFDEITMFGEKYLDETLYELMKACSRKRMLECYGIIRHAKKELNIEDIENENSDDLNVELEGNTDVLYYFRYCNDYQEYYFINAEPVKRK